MVHGQNRTELLVVRWLMQDLAPWASETRPERATRSERLPEGRISILDLADFSNLENFSKSSPRLEKSLRENCDPSWGMRVNCSGLGGDAAPSLPRRVVPSRICVESTTGKTSKPVWLGVPMEHTPQSPDALPQAFERGRRGGKGTCGPLPRPTAPPARGVRGHFRDLAVAILPEKLHSSGSEDAQVAQKIAGECAMYISLPRIMGRYILKGEKKNGEIGVPPHGQI